MPQAQAGPAEAGSTPTGSPRTIEDSDARLKAALAANAARPTPQTLAAVGAEYSRLGVYDLAIAHLNQVIRLAPSDASLFAARARAHRDSGVPEVGLADASRATYLDPRSADAFNTLGTIQLFLGQSAEAAASFERALTLAPDAAWALNNLCYAALMDGDEEIAVGRCEKALARDPASMIARNNLAMVHAAAGRIDEARVVLMASGDTRTAEFNFGILLMARRDYARAAQAFGAACALAKDFDAACRRAMDARKLAAETSGRVPR